MPSLRNRMKESESIFLPMNFDRPGFADFALERLEYHRAHPEVKPADYRQKKRLRLAKKVMACHRIYLDTKFWINFRDVICGSRKEPSNIELLDVLREARKIRKVICPLSYSSIKELFYQSDFETRRTTACLMDELSEAICIQPPHVLFDTELWNLMSHAVLSAGDAPLPTNAVWTKAAYYLGEPEFECEVLPEDVRIVMQKCVDDSLFDCTVLELVESLEGASQSPKFDIDAQASLLTEGKTNHPETSFAELYRQEVAGGLEAHHKNCCDTMLELCKSSGFRGTVTAEEYDATGRMVRALIENAVRLGKVNTTFPQLHISASLHAAIRWDTQRCYKRGDCEDFRHAGSALPYCDFFLTEKSLSHLMCNKPLKLNTEYSTTVLNDAGSAIKVLSKLL
jgi:hypothetical protein